MPAIGGSSDHVFIDDELTFALSDPGWFRRQSRLDFAKKPVVRTLARSNDQARGESGWVSGKDAFTA